MSPCRFDSEAIDFRVVSERFAWQFYDTYRGNEKVATLLRQLPWSSNRHVLAKCKCPEEREFSALTEFALPLEAAPR